MRRTPLLNIRSPQHLMEAQDVFTPYPGSLLHVANLCFPGGVSLFN